MTTIEYRDELDGLSDAISGFKAAANYGERALESGRLERWWSRLARVEQPIRLPQADRDRCQRLMAHAAAMLNDWLIEVNAGLPENEEVKAAPEQAMKDTMRFCAVAKRHGLS